MERYGLNLMASDLAEIERRLESGEGVLCERRPDGKEIRLIEIGDVRARVVWKPDPGIVVTFMPPRNGREHRPMIADRYKKRGQSRRLMRERMAD